MARIFNGSSDFIILGNNNAFFAPTAICISAWVYPTSLTPAYSAVVSRVGASAFWQLLIKSTGKAAYYVRAGGTTIAADPGVISISTNVWTHLLMFYSSTVGLNAYVNGVFDVSTAGSSPMDTGFTTENAELGNDTSTAGRLFTGSISNVTIWKSTIFATSSVQEINALVHGFPPARRSSMIGDWRLDGYNAPVFDSGPNKLNGVLSGTTLAVGPPLINPRPALTAGVSFDMPKIMVPPAAAQFILLPQILT